jgi:hypothetical protein
MFALSPVQAWRLSMVFVVLAAVVCGVVYLVIRRNRERSRNAPLVREIEAQVCFESRLDRVCKLGTGGFGVIHVDPALQDLPRPGYEMSVPGGAHLARAADVQSGDSEMAMTVP